MKLSSRGALRAVTATVAALTLSVIAAAPSLATAPVDTIVLDPAASLGPIGAWAPLDESGLGASEESAAALAHRVIAEVVADPASGAGTALLGTDLPASAAAVHAHFAEFVATDALVLAGSSDHALATYAAGRASVVYANDADAVSVLALDLRSFSQPAGATVATYTTDSAGELVAGAAGVVVDATGIVPLTVAAGAVLTVVIDGLAERPASAPVARAAVEAPASELVGEPVASLLESGHATGKTVELGNPAAQQTTSGGATYTAPAAAFTIGRTAAAVQAQALTLYPVLGAATADTYVIAGPDGRVLVRRDNAAADYRYLDLRETTVDAAAADPYAQWTLVPAGNGWSYVHNVQRDGSGAVAALDMYNWATNDASEVQTYSSGTAAVQRWRLHTLAPTVAPVTGVIEQGTVPTLPTALRAAYSWGPRVALGSVTWQLPAADVWHTEGTVTVDGSGLGYFGEQVPVTATYTVGTLAASVEASMNTFAGAQLVEVRMRAPRTVERAVSGSGSTVTVPVTWDWDAVTDADFAAAGTVVVPSVEGLGFAAKLTVTVASSETVNILRGSGIHGEAPNTNANIGGLTDGVINAEGYSNWRSGGAANRINPDMVSFVFDEPRQVTGASVYDTAGTNVGGVTVQYRDLIGGWIDLPGATWPAVNTSNDLSLVVDTTPVVATGVRVIFTHKSDSTWMRLSEVEVRGPAVSAL